MSFANNLRPHIPSPSLATSTTSPSASSTPPLLSTYLDHLYLPPYIAKTLYGDDDEEVTPQNSDTVEEPKCLGLYPGSNEKILLKNGPYGFYVQLGEDRKGYLPKRASVSQGNHPDDGQPVVLKLEKFGFSIRHRHTIASVPENLKPNDITFEKALELLLGKDVVVLVVLVVEVEGQVGGGGGGVVATLGCCNYIESSKCLNPKGLWLLQSTNGIQVSVMTVWHEGFGDCGVIQNYKAILNEMIRSVSTRSGLFRRSNPKASPTCP
ncbi:hypothetical protein ACSBR2_008791 [Camellia fascicularis]